MSSYEKYQIAKVTGMSSDGDLLQVQSMSPKSDHAMGGVKYGYRYEWGVNHCSFTANKEDTMEKFGLSAAEWDYWNQFFVIRFNQDLGEWYEDHAVGTYLALVNT